MQQGSVLHRVIGLFAIRWNIKNSGEISGIMLLFVTALLCSSLGGGLLWQQDIPEERLQALIALQAEMAGDAADQLPTAAERVATRGFTTVDESYFDDALFIGDSLVTGLDIYGIIPNATYIASTGVNLDTLGSEGMVTLADGRAVSMLQAIATCAVPGKIYVMLGTNGINWQSIPTMIERYDELLQNLQTRFPQSLIYVQSILPTTREVPLAQPGFAKEHLEAYNQQLEELAADRGAVYLNLHGVLADAEGYLLSDVAGGDGIHMNHLGYALWYAYLKEHALVGP